MDEIISKLNEILGTNETKWWSFIEYEWTKEQEKQFKVWFIDKLADDVGFRRNILITNRKSTKLFMAVVDEFIWTYWPKDLPNK